MFRVMCGLLFAYLAGSFPTGVLVGKLFFGRDPRDEGSKASGGTNMFRVFGPRAAIPVILIDVGKGALAVWLAATCGAGGVVPEQLMKIGGALLAMTGHVYPVFAGFRGGKGVATGAGALLFIMPWASLCALGGFLLVLGLTGIVSASSIIASLVLPVSILFGVQGKPLDPWHLGFSIAISIFIIFSHRANIRRILRGEERAFEKLRFLRR